MLVQRFEPQGRRFTNFHYYYYVGVAAIASMGTSRLARLPGDEIFGVLSWWRIPNVPVDLGVKGEVVS